MNLYSYQQEIFSAPASNLKNQGPKRRVFKEHCGILLPASCRKMILQETSTFYYGVNQRE